MADRATADDLARLLSVTRQWLAGGPQVRVGEERLAAGASASTIDPSTGEVLGEVPVAGPDDVDRAVELAAAAQRDWYRSGLAARRTALERLGAVIQEHTDELAMLDAIDSGNHFDGMRADIRRSFHQFSTWPALAGMLGGVTLGLDPSRAHYTELEPYGVVARITAYNHPAYFVIKAMLPPLTMGNTVVIKPAEQTPLSALRIAELAATVLPAGVLTVLPGDGRTGDALVRHRLVKRIGFTGSVATGRRIQSSAADSGVKHVTLELGGKNALVVFPDADIDAVADAAVRGMNFDTCQGQSCGSTSRVFAHAAVHDRLVEAIARRLAPIRLGAAYEAGVDMGPLISAAHRDRVVGMLATAVQEGAQLVEGSAELVERPGYFVRPALLAGVEQHMQIARDEVFGPVISVLRWDDWDRMIAEVNAVDYGLTAAVWSNDHDAVMRTVRAIDAGYIWVNDVSTHYFGLPFGGTKHSGVGREEDAAELASFAEVKAISVRSAPWAGRG